MHGYSWACMNPTILHMFIKDLLRKGNFAGKQGATGEEILDIMERFVWGFCGSGCVREVLLRLQKITSFVF